MSDYSTEKSAENVTEQEPPCNRGLIDEFTIDWFVNTADLTLFVLTFISTALQIYVIRKALRHIRRGSGDQCLHVFLLSMTFGDFLLTGFCYPLEFITRMELVTVPKIINEAVHFSTWVALSGSSLSLILLNVEKLIYFKYPLRYSSFVTRKRGVSIAITVWAISVLFVAGSWYLQCFKCVDKNCRTLSLFGNTMVMYIIFTLSVCIAPTITSLAVACYILKVVSTQRRKLAEEQALYNSGQSTVSSALSGRLRTFYFIFMTTVFTAATLLPFRIYQVKSKFFEDSNSSAFTEKKDCSQFFMLWVMSYLITFNALLNPLITVTVLPQYRWRIVNKFISASNNFQTKTTEL